MYANVWELTANTECDTQGRENFLSERLVQNCINIYSRYDNSFPKLNTKAHVLNGKESYHVQIDENSGAA